MRIGPPVAEAVSVTEEPLHIVGNSGIIATIVAANAIPLNPIEIPVWVTPVADNICVAVFAVPYSNQREAVLTPTVMSASVPVTSAGK